MHASQPEGRQLKLRDVIEAMRRLGIAARLEEPQAGSVTDARGAALAIVSADGMFLSANRSAAALLGYSSGELIGRRLLDMAPESDRATLAAQLSGDPAREFYSFSTLLAGRTGRPTRLVLHQQLIAADQNEDLARLTLFEEPLAPEELLEDDAQLSEAEARSRLKYLMIGQQRERQRLAADLHDGMGQALTLIKLMVEDARMRLRRGQAEDAAQKLDATVLQIRETIGEMRQICGELRPLALERLGLPAALSTLCRGVDRGAAHLLVHFHCDIDDRDVPEHLKADIFRVAQEALNNSVKHAAATEIRLALQRIETGLLLTIQDNGTGYDTRPLSLEAMSSTGLGLTGMQQRVESQGGFLSVHSSDNSGTLVSASWTL
ncbi:histidine kinase [Paraburkholderia lacunae]|uniref:histidine kinase n=1 Tax=Paraburkholderia lacunae TaxID=2211104 RepID=A0A370MWP1_9BURK|nr:histidine kinase [Paraburkholderia lacunae]RDJ97744.1 histidine kinase [Paraburkholderia lacunae]